MRRSTLAAWCGAFALLAVAACSADDGGERRLDLSEDAGSPEAPADEEETPEAEGEGPEPLATSFPEVGLEFESLPKATGPRRAALETYVAYERGLRQLSRTARPNRLITDHASQPLVDTMDSTLDYLRSNDVRYRGTAVISVAFDGASTRAAVLDLCTDGTGLELVTAGEPGPIEGLERVAGRVVLTATGNTWSVTQYDTLEESC